MNTPAIPANEEDRLRSLYDSGLLDTGISELFDRLTQLAKRLFNVPYALVTLVAKETLQFKTSDGLAYENFPRDLSFCGHAILNAAPLIINDCQNDTRFADNPVVSGEPGLRFYAGYPLSLPDGAIAGVLCLADIQPREFTPGELEILKDLASIVENEFAVLSATSTDELTGLFNRRAFGSLVKFAISSARRRAEPLTLARLDLAELKKINADWGRTGGDDALRSLAAVMRANLRDADLLVRYGSNEFVILFSDTDEKGAWIAVKHLVEQTKAWNLTSGKPWSLSFNWGVSEFDHNGAGDVQAWLNDANVKMMDMKTHTSRKPQ
ncbi:sensor domain-containing diguanylate cyclase [Phytobacter sp. V91]|uniref:sensor domain-containing diguanylate cyclase n=1 Tax=Phytobacter sp. V91 TaxID=3369425 RepID=UPI003F5DC0BC